MKLEYNGFKLNLEAPVEIDPQKDTILFLHGFTGCAEDWFHVFETLPNNYNYIAMDLIGHGKSENPGNTDNYKIDSIIEQLKFVKDHLTKNKIILCGYSMGGRIALSYAVAYPEDLKGLILESASAGIKNDAERSKRFEDDLQIIEYIEKHSTEEFIDFWMDQQMFNTQRRFSNDKLKKLKKKKYSSSKIGLANSLRGFSTGVMPPLHDKLKSLTFKVLLISGELDPKYTYINSKLTRLFFKAKHKVVKYSGHNTHLEEPKRFNEIVTNYLNQLNSVNVTPEKKNKVKNGRQVDKG